MPARRIAAPTILTVVFLLSLPLVTPRIFASDEIHYFAYLRSLWFDRDVSFDNEYRYFFDRGIGTAHGFEEAFLERRSETGRAINFGTIGSAILWAPFYGAADLLVAATHGFGGRYARDGFSQPYIAAVCYATALYGFLALLLGLRIVEMLMGVPPRAAAVWGVLAVWFGTPLAFYMYLSPIMAHATSAFACALFLVLWLRARSTWTVSAFVMLGASAALMVMTREQDAFYLPAIAIDLAWCGMTAIAAARRNGEWTTVRRMVASAAAAVAAGLALFLPQALAYIALNGRIGPSRLVSRKMHWTAPHGLEVLWSPEHGLFFWTPLALLLLGAGVWWAWRPPALRTVPPVFGGRRVWAILLLVVFSHVYVAGSLGSWTAAGAFGQRRFISVTPVFVIWAVALIAQASRRWRPMLLAAVTLSVYWNLGLMYQFGARLMDRQRLDVERAARVSFVELPRELPALTYRFLFDRASFFAHPGKE